MRKIVYFLFCFISVSSLHAQSYSLQQCIDTALQRNIPVQQSGLLAQTAEVNLRQARMNLLPNLNADINHGINSGRSIDPFTNTYVNQSVNTANYGIGSGVVLFNGLTLQNRIRQNATAYDASRMEWQQAKDNLVLNVILAYLQVLNNEDQVELATRQALTSQKALDRLQVMDSMGAIKPSDVSDLKGQLMNDQLAIIDARGQLATAKLNLAQLMSRPYDTAMQLQRVDATEFLATYSNSPSDVYEHSLLQFAQVKAVELRTKSAYYALRSERGLLYPQLSLNAGLNTTYSSVATNSSGKIPYGSQLKNNRFSTVGLGISLPIFNSSITRNRIRIADINLKSTQLTEDNTKLLLRQQIDQAYVNMTNSLDRYRLLQQQVVAYQESFSAAEVRFNAGVGTSIDYLTAKDRLDRANTNLLNARYDFVLRKRVLDYYYGKP